MIIMLLAGVIETPDPSVVWYMAAIELLIESVIVTALVSIVVL